MVNQKKKKEIANKIISDLNSGKLQWSDSPFNMYVGNNIGTLQWDFKECREDVGSDEFYNNYLSFVEDDQRRRLLASGNILPNNKELEYWAEARDKGIDFYWTHPIIYNDSVVAYALIGEECPHDKIYYLEGIFDSENQAWEHFKKGRIT